MSQKLTVLVVDDDESILKVLEARLASAGYEVLTASDGETGLEKARAHGVDLVVSDVKMPGMSGYELLKELTQEFPGLPVIMLTAYGTIPDAVGAMQIGAVDYLTKPFDGRELLEKINSMLQEAPARPSGEASPVSKEMLGGEAESMRKVYSLIERMAPKEVTVLILGESGTGKELAARALHKLSKRSGGPVVPVDCGSTPANLLESELFGHVKGSFTHALKDKKGLMEAADKGTLFLDEIGNISQEMQTRLLRFMEERTIRRIGDTKEITLDCRVLAATNADLPEMVESGDFREDLYFRIKGVTLKIPPLRERKEDIPLLAEHFAEQYARTEKQPKPKIPAKTMQVLMQYSWPGNVRELKHTVEAGLVLCENNTLTPDDLQLRSSSVVSHAGGESLSLEDSEHQTILRALEQSNWVQKKAADLLGISRRAVHYKIKKYGIKIPGK